VKASQFLALAGASAALAACAGGPSHDGRERRMEMQRVLLSADTLVFATFDANNDLRIDAGERDAGIAREWARADANSDGALQPLEFQAWMTNALGGSNMPPYRLDFDRNVDNAITREEFDTELEGRFNDYDADKDGVVTRAEFIRELPRPQMREGGGGPPQQMRRRPPG
jgi:EF hand